MIKGENYHNRTDNVLSHPGKVSYEQRCQLYGHKGLVVWFTGLSGSGKSTLAVETELILWQKGFLVYRLDSDNVRQGLNKDLGFSREGRFENIRRLAETAKIMRDAGFIVLVCAITPTEDLRRLASDIVGEGYYETYVKADLELCSSRDPRGLYKKAQKGIIKNLTGLSDPFQEPVSPSIILDTGYLEVNLATDMMVEEILRLIKL